MGKLGLPIRFLQGFFVVNLVYLEDLIGIYYGFVVVVYKFTFLRIGCGVVIRMLFCAEI